MKPPFRFPLSGSIATPPWVLGVTIAAIGAIAPVTLAISKGKEIDISRMQAEHRMQMDLVDRAMNPNLDPELRHNLLALLARLSQGELKGWAQAELANLNATIIEIQDLRAQSKRAAIEAGTLEVQLQEANAEITRLQAVRVANPTKLAKAEENATRLQADRRAAVIKARQLSARLASEKQSIPIIDAPDIVKETTDPLTR